MTKEERVELLKGFRKQYSWLMAQAAEYESGRPGSAIENGIYAAHKCAEMATKLRRQADNLAIMIAAYENTDEEYHRVQGGLVD